MRAVRFRSSRSPLDFLASLGRKATFTVIENLGPL